MERLRLLSDAAGARSGGNAVDAIIDTGPGDEPQLSRAVDPVDRATASRDFSHRFAPVRVNQVRKVPTRDRSGPPQVVAGPCRRHVVETVGGRPSGIGSVLCMRVILGAALAGALLLLAGCGEPTPTPTPTDAASEPVFASEEEALAAAEEVFAKYVEASTTDGNQWRDRPVRVRRPGHTETS